MWARSGLAHREQVLMLGLLVWSMEAEVERKRKRKRKRQLTQRAHG
jgi:hypothetical protein